MMKIAVAFCKVTNPLDIQQEQIIYDSSILNTETARVLQLCDHILLLPFLFQLKAKNPYILQKIYDSSISQLQTLGLSQLHDNTIANISLNAFETVELQFIFKASRKFIDLIACTPIEYCLYDIMMVGATPLAQQYFNCDVLNITNTDITRIHKILMTRETICGTCKKQIFENLIVHNPLRNISRCDDCKLSTKSISSSSSSSCTIHIDNRRQTIIKTLKIKHNKW